MGQLQKELGNYRELGYQIIAVAQDSPEVNAGVMKKQGLTFPIYSDAGQEASRAFGLLFSVDEKTVELYKNYNIDLVGLYGRAKPVMAVPAVFLVGTDGKVKFEYVNPNYQQRLDPKILRAAMEVYR